MIVFSTPRQTVGGDGCVSKVQGVRGGNRRQRDTANGGGGGLEREGERRKRGWGWGIRGAKRRERWNWSKRGGERWILGPLCFCSNCPNMMNGLQILLYSWKQTSLLCTVSLLWFVVCFTGCVGLLQLTKETVKGGNECICVKQQSIQRWKAWCEAVPSSDLCHGYSVLFTTQTCSFWSGTVHHYTHGNWFAHFKSRFI